MGEEQAQEEEQALEQVPEKSPEQALEQDQALEQASEREQAPNQAPEQAPEQEQAQKQSRNRIIFCVLNKLVLGKDANGNKILPRECSYSKYKIEEKFTGIQANEASVKALLKIAHDSHQEAIEIDYLCSNECCDKTIPASLVSHLPGFEDVEDEPLSTEEFFDRRITQFCRDKGYNNPVFNPIEYTPRYPTDSLSAINKCLDRGYEIAIDLTGGRRDAVFLELLAMQLLRYKRDNSEGANSVVKALFYASFEDECIIDQTPTTELIQLVNAVEAFTRYGKTDQLYEFFSYRHNSEHVSLETKDLLEKMQSFANALELCQVQDIDEKTKQVQQALQKTRERHEVKSKHFELLTNAISTIDNPNAWWLEGEPLEEQLRAIENSEISSDGLQANNENLKEQLKELRQPYTTIRSELILQFLIPSIQEKFIQKEPSNAKLICEIIRWCADHQLIQQALCIFREKISECLLELGYFEPTERFKNLEPEKQKKIVDGLAFKCLPDKYPEGDEYLYLQDRPDNDIDLSFYMKIKNHPEIMNVIAWCHYIRGRRNSVMHAAPPLATQYYLFACSYLGKDSEVIPTVQSLTDDLRNALDCIQKHSQAVDLPRWNEALNKLEDTPEKVKERRKQKKDKEWVDGNPKLVEPSSPDELLELMKRFDENHDEVDANEFRTWCSRQHVQLKKANFGVAKKKSLFKKISEQYPKMFSYRTIESKSYLKRHC